MNARDLIQALLIEAGEREEAERIYKLLENNEFANSQIGADLDEGHIRYIECIANETPCYIGLICERE